MEDQIIILVINLYKIKKKHPLWRRLKVKAKVMRRCLTCVTSETSDQSLMCHHAVNLGSVIFWKTEKGLKPASTEQSKWVARVWIYIPWKHAVIYQHTSANPIGRKYLAGSRRACIRTKLVIHKGCQRSRGSHSNVWAEGLVLSARVNLLPCVSMVFSNIWSKKAKGAATNQKKKTIFSFLGLQNLPIPVLKKPSGHVPFQIFSK